MIDFMKQIKVDQDTCIGCGSCVSLAEKTFKLNENGKSTPIDPAEDSEEAIQGAIDSCPVTAISWMEETND